MKIHYLFAYLFSSASALMLVLNFPQPTLAQGCDGNYHSSTGVQVDTSGNSREQSRRVNSRINCPNGNRFNNGAPTNVNADTGVQYTNNCNHSPARNNDISLSGNNTVNVGTNVAVDVCDPSRGGGR